MAAVPPAGAHVRRSLVLHVHLLRADGVGVGNQGLEGAEMRAGPGRSAVLHIFFLKKLFVYSRSTL
jgi:hypothetical protein